MEKSKDELLELTQVVELTGGNCVVMVDIEAVTSWIVRDLRESQWLRVQQRDGLADSELAAAICATWLASYRFPKNRAALDGLITQHVLETVDWNIVVIFLKFEARMTAEGFPLND